MLPPHIHADIALGIDRPGDEGSNQRQWSWARTARPAITCGKTSPHPPWIKAWRPAQGSPGNGWVEKRKSRPTPNATQL